MVDSVQEDETRVVHLVLNLQQVEVQCAILLTTVLLLGHSVIMNCNTEIIQSKHQKYLNYSNISQVKIMKVKYLEQRS